MDISPFIVIFAIFLVAVLYSSVGHGGASGYLAVMALMAIAPEITRPTALTLNLFVASIATVQYYRAGHFSWRLFAPFAIASVPMAYIGGTIQLPTNVYRIILGVVLVLAAARLSWKFENENKTAEPAIWLAVVIGAALGLLSGLVGVGGGIFLTPLLLLLNWAPAKTAAGISALFIFVNSAAGLAGAWGTMPVLPQEVYFWIVAAIVGGLIGSTLGAKRFDSIMLRRILALVLVFAGGKLILT